MSDLPNITQNNEQILNDIQSLQQMEQQLFNSLETNPNLSSSQKQKIVQILSVLEIHLRFSSFLDIQKKWTKNRHQTSRPRHQRKQKNRLSARKPS